MDGSSLLPAELAAIGQYPPQRIYALAEHERRRQLAAVYNHSAVNFGGVFIFDTTPSQGEYFRIFNGSLPSTIAVRPAQIEPELFSSVSLRKDAIDYDSHDGRPVLNREQQRQAVGSPMARLLGRLATSGLALSAPATELATINPIGGATVGVAATAAAFGLWNLLGRRRERSRATQALQNFDAYVSQVENGAVSFSLQDVYYSACFSVRISRTEFLQAKAYNLQPDEYAPQSKKEETKYVQSIYPADLVLASLAGDRKPAELWNSGLGEQARYLAEAERRILAGEERLAAAVERQKFTGQAVPKETKAITQEMEEARQALFAAALAMAKLSQERIRQQREARRITTAHRLIDEVLNGDAKEPHRLEMHLQLLHSVASEALSTLDLSSADSDVIAREMGEYLKGTRKLLTDRNQMEQFYEGLRAKFADRLPGAFLDWNEVAMRLPKAET